MTILTFSTCMITFILKYIKYISLCIYKFIHFVTFTASASLFLMSITTCEFYTCNIVTVFIKMLLQYVRCLLLQYVYYDIIQCLLR